MFHQLRNSSRVLNLRLRGYPPVTIDRSQELTNLVNWRAPDSFTELIKESEMTLSITELVASTEEELQQALAGLLAHARDEVLNDMEVQEFWRIHQEIQRRCSHSGAAA